MSAPLLLVPGTLCDERVFAAMIQRLGSDARSLPPIAHDNVGDAAAALLAAAPPRFVAGGFSLGGFVVLEVLRRAPERLAGAVLIASHALPPQPAQTQTRQFEVELARVSGMAAVIDTLWSRYVADARRADLGLRHLVTSMAEAVGPKLFARQTALALGRPDSRATVRDTAVPLLILTGAQDRMCPPGAYAATTGAGVQVTTFEGAGHFLPLEAPDLCAAAITAWSKERGRCC